MNSSGIVARYLPWWQTEIYVQRLPTTLFPLVLRKEYFDCPERDSYAVHYTYKGTVSRDFLLLVLFINQFPPSPRVFH